MNGGGPPDPNLSKIGWVLSGGETGIRARVSHGGERCLPAEPPFLVKLLNRWCKDSWLISSLE